MREIDKQEEIIVKELIKNPRISDNQISKNTGVPVKTVNRKRKKLEKEGLLYYFTYLNNGPHGTGVFTARQLYIVTFKLGITRKQILDMIKKEEPTKIELKHIAESYLGDVDGHSIIAMIIESRLESDIIEIFNAELIPKFKRFFGEDAVVKTEAITLNIPLRTMHNYMFLVNMSHGKIKEEWPDELIFVD
ncbi:MAG: winged helix-turn-helix domain-containing protein [Nanoarchaeota archaeon]|nr:winged helix-turn-helix domain-containing protein [Nanoarchaeota archaeon]MBU4283934.1 winged helix-turn-helix domain-containing protein [Nanoarchaeota archaeon]MBU4493097.1 winged helix-turn-helix domain-containing protein [Nanoarchaeota archaeon]